MERANRRGAGSPRAGLRTRPGRILLLALLSAAASGCVGTAPDSEASRAASPWVEIGPASRLGPYLAADVRGVNSTHRFLFAPGGPCGVLLASPGRALYLPEGRFGSLAESPEAPRCGPVGVLSLARWRDQLPRRRSRYLSPEVDARFRPAGSGPETLLVRGHIPLAIELLFPDPEDVIAVLPDTPACREAMAERGGTIAYLAEGPDVLVLTDPEPPCPIRGLALPLTLE